MQKYNVTCKIAINTYEDTDGTVLDGDSVGFGTNETIPGQSKILLMDRRTISILRHNTLEY